MSVTLKDIAREASVSISTVSRVINNDSNKAASRETTERIWGIVKKLGYTPNQNARNLIKGEKSNGDVVSKRTIGCIFTSTLDTNSDPFFSQIGLGVQEELKNQEYVMAYALSIYGMDFSKVYNYITTNKVDGIIVMGRFKKDILDLFMNNFSNIIYTGVNSIGGKFDEVICDGYKGIKYAIEYLVANNHNKIGFIGTTILNDVIEKNEFINEHRYQAYINTLKKHNIPFEPEFSIETKLGTKEAYDKTIEYLKQEKSIPTAFCCANDVTAIGAMKAFKENGLRVPEDISIIGLDDIEMSSFVSPALTTIQIQKEELGRTAVKNLIDKINTGRNYPIRIDLPVNLIERDSVSKL